MPTKISGFLLAIGLSVTGAAAQVPPTALPEQSQQPSTIGHAEAHPTGPPVTLAELLQEALEKNPELIALKAQVDVVRQRPIQERFLNAPMAEAQVWQWPFNSISP